MGRKTGVSEEQLGALASFEISPHFTQEERLVLRLATELTRAPASVSDKLYQELCERFSERELVELTAVIAWENYRARSNRVFAIESEDFSKGQFCPVPER